MILHRDKGGNPIRPIQAILQREKDPRILRRYFPEVQLVFDERHKRTLIVTYIYSMGSYP